MKAAERIRRALAAACPCDEHNGAGFGVARPHGLTCICPTCRVARSSYQLNGIEAAQ
jgi:hypothetical protein